MASTSAAADSDSNRPADADPPAPPPPIHHPLPPPPQGHAVFVQELYRDQLRRRRLLLLRREAGFLCRAAIWGLSAFLIFATLYGFISLILHPTFPQLRVISATVSSVSTAGDTVSADCNITFILTNPNRHLKTMYDAMEFSLLYPSQQAVLSQNHHRPFSQPKKNQSTIETNLSFNTHDLNSDVVTAMKQELDRGILSLAVKIAAVVRYRNGKWKTTAQFMRAYCGGVSFGFTSTQKPGIFLNPYHECEVYLYTK